MDVNGDDDDAAETLNARARASWANNEAAAVCATAVLLCESSSLVQVQQGVVACLPQVKRATYSYVATRRIDAAPRCSTRKFHMQGRLLVPTVPCMLVRRSRPVIPLFSEYLLNHLTGVTVALAVIFAIVVCLNITIALGDGSDASLAWSATPIFIAQGAAMSAASVLFLAVCSRELMWALAKTFDFWYISFQCLLMWFSVSTVVLSSAGGWCATAAVRLVSDAFYALAIAMAVGAFDASPFSRQTKGAISVCVGLFFAVSLALMWTGESYSTKAWQASVTVENWNFSAQTLYRLASLNVTIFCVKFAVKSLYFECDAVILSCGKEISLCDVIACEAREDTCDTELTASTLAASS